MPKLVRDKIPAKILSNSEIPEYHIEENDARYWAYLREKLKEEVEEYLESESNEELVDILEVLDAIKTFKRIDNYLLLKSKATKARELGTFKNRVILDGVRTDDPA